MEEVEQPLSIQECYSPENSHCFGCGQANEKGLKLKSYLVEQGTCAVCTHTPEAKYTGGVPHNLYGGYIAMLFDCHGTASAAGFYAVANHLSVSPGGIDRFVTAHLEIDYLAPTPMNRLLTVQAYPVEVTNRKVILRMELEAGNKQTARAQMVAVRMVDKK